MTLLAALGMSFASSGLLIGGAVAAVAIPVLIHLFNRTRFVRTRWAAMEFLLAAFRKTRRRVRLENLLLMFLRILALLFIALTLSRPSVSGEVPLPKASHLVVVVDNSYSMSAGSGGETALTRSKNFLARVLSPAALGESDALTLIRTSERLSDYFRLSGATLLDPETQFRQEKRRYYSANVQARIRTAEVLAQTLQAKRSRLERQVPGPARQKALEALGAERIAAQKALDDAYATGEAEIEANPTLKNQLTQRLIELREAAADPRAAADSADSGTSGEVAAGEPPSAGRDSAGARKLFTTEHNGVRRKLKETKVVPVEPDWIQTLALVREALKASEQRYETKNVVIVTDLQARNFPKAGSPVFVRYTALLKEITADAGIVLQDVGQPVIENAAILKASLVNQVTGVGVPLQIRVTLANRSIGTPADEPRKIELSYAIDGERPRLAATEPLKPGETRELMLENDLPAFETAGIHTIELSLSDDDLDTDNHAYLVVDVVKAIQLLVVDGAVGKYRFNDETFYFYVALDVVSAKRLNNPKWKNPKTAIRIVKAKLSDLPNLDLFEYDGVVLANVSDIDNRITLEALERYVAAGYPMIITLGDQVNKAAYNERLYAGGQGLLPLPLDRTIGDYRDKTGLSAMSMVVTDPQHRSIASLYQQDHDPNRATDFLGAPKIFQCYRTAPLDPPPPGLHEVLAVQVTASQSDRVPEGATAPAAYKTPLLVYKPFGRGVVYLFTTTLDNLWCTLPMMKMYVPFWQELVYAITETPNLHKHLLVGDVYRRPVLPGELTEENYVFRPGVAPDNLGNGIRISLTPVRADQTRRGDLRGELVFRKTTRPGLYQLRMLKNRKSLEVLVNRALDAVGGIPATERRTIGAAAVAVLTRAKSAEARQVLDKALQPFVDAGRLPGGARLAGLIEMIFQTTRPLLGEDAEGVITIADAFAVNLETTESALTRVARSAKAVEHELRERFRGALDTPEKLEVRALKALDADAAPPQLVAQESSIWRYALYAALLLLALEMFFARVFTSRQR